MGKSGTKLKNFRLDANRCAELEDLARQWNCSQTKVIERLIQMAWFNPRPVPLSSGPTDGLKAISGNSGKAVARDYKPLLKPKDQARLKPTASREAAKRQAKMAYRNPHDRDIGQDRESVPIDQGPVSPANKLVEDWRRSALKHHGGR